MSSRSSGYSQEEDRLLCQVYMEISQDPIKGIYQSSDQFWSRVIEAYESGKNTTWSERSKRSIQSRVQTIEKATKKLHACIRQCENRRPSGASNDDILNQAKLMLQEDPNFKTGWRFEHVWNIVKDFEKFKDGVARKRISIPSRAEYTSLESENPSTDSPTQVSPGLSTFSLNLNDSDELIGGSPSSRPSGIKKSKMKTKHDDQTKSLINTLDEGNKQLMEQLKRTSAQRQDQLEIQQKNYALREMEMENQMLLYDTSSLSDPNIRAYFEGQQAKILQKRNAEQAPPPSTSFGQYFDYLSGSGSGFPH